jgi:hypothetical protein
MVAITAAAGAWLQSPYIFLFLAYDFFVRGFDKKQWSLFRFIGIKTVNLLEVREKLIDAGGKKFAAKIGLIFSATLTLTTMADWTYLTLVLGGLLVLFAMLESVLAFCMGCKIYSLLNKIAFKLSFLTRSANQTAGR